MSFILHWFLLQSMVISAGNIAKVAASNSPLLKCKRSDTRLCLQRTLRYFYLHSLVQQPPLSCGMMRQLAKAISKLGQHFLEEFKLAIPIRSSLESIHELLLNTPINISHLYSAPLLTLLLSWAIFRQRASKDANRMLTKTQNYVNKYQAYCNQNMINRKRLITSLQNQPSKSGFLKWLQNEVKQTSSNLSDPYCTFLINQNYQIRANNIIVQLLCIPKQGLYADIEFRPKLFFNTTKLVERPSIYNDRRIFHPNINAYTCEFVSRQLVLEWNPTKEYPPLYKRFSALLQHLKYLMIQPICEFVPNNRFNRNAAWHFHFNKANYRNLIEKFSPTYLENEVSKDLNLYAETAMQMESTRSDTFDQNDYWSIDKSIPKNRVMSVLQSFEQNAEEQDFEFLAKKINSIALKNEDNIPKCSRVDVQ